MASCLCSSTSFLFLERVHYKRKEFAPNGRKFSPLRVDPFSEGDRNNFERVISPESVSFPHMSLCTYPKI